MYTKIEQRSRKEHPRECEISISFYQDEDNEVTLYITRCSEGWIVANKVDAGEGEYHMDSRIFVHINDAVTMGIVLGKVFGINPVSVGVMRRLDIDHDSYTEESIGFGKDEIGSTDLGDRVTKLLVPMSFGATWASEQCISLN